MSRLQVLPLWHVAFLPERSASDTAIELDERGGFQI